MLFLEMVILAQYLPLPYYLLYRAVMIPLISGSGIVIATWTNEPGPIPGWNRLQEWNRIQSSV